MLQANVVCKITLCAGPIAIQDSDDELPKCKKQTQAASTSPDELETQLYRMNTDVVQNCLAECCDKGMPAEPVETSKPVFRRIRAKSHSSLQALPSSSATPSPKPQVDLDISPVKTYPTREDQLNMKAWKALEKENQGNVVAPAGATSEVAMQDWTEEQEEEMWVHYYEWCSERLKPKKAARASEAGYETLESN